MKILLRWTIALAILAVGLGTLTLSDSFSIGPSVASAAEVGDPLDCAQGSHLAVKLVDGIDIDRINAEYGTTVVQTFPGTNIYVLAPPERKSAKKLARSLRRAEWFVWSEIGQFNGSVSIQQGFSGARVDGFSAASLDGFSQAALDGFSQAVLDGFSQAVLDGFSQAALDGFSQAALDGFTQADLDGFSAAALDGFTQAVLEQFAAAILDQFTQAMLDQFSTAYFLDLTIDALDGVYGARARDQAAMLNINALGAHEYATGKGVTVAVVDTGISNHWYFRDRIVPGGWDFIDNDNDPTDELAWLDDNGNGLRDEGWGHGTHVAGIVRTVAPDATILPIRVQNSEGESWSFIVAEGIEYAVDHGADVVNVSMGVRCKSESLEYAVKYAASRGVTVVAAAGNADKDNLHYPAAYTHSVAVAAVDNNDIKALFSNYDSKVTVSAPGVEIYSTYGEGQFAWWSGTSQATPMIAGEAALILSAKHALLPSELSSVISQSADNIDGLNPEYVNMLGGGRANLLAAVQPSAELNDTSSDEPSYTSHNDEPTVTLIDEPDDTSSEKVSKKKPKKKRHRKGRSRQRD